MHVDVKSVAVNDSDVKKSARYSRMFNVTELLVSMTQYFSPKYFSCRFWNIIDYLYGGGFIINVSMTLTFQGYYLH